MKKFQNLFLIFFLLIVFFFKPLILQGKFPIPSDTIIGLYHPFRDVYAKNYPNGIPFKNFLITDPVRQQYPWRNLAIGLEKNLELPLWNPYSMSGTPLLAGMQSASFYPMNLLFFILPFSSAWSALILLEPLLAGIFIYFYLDNLELKREASILGATTFAFSGFTTAWLEWGTVVHVALWLPLILLSIDKIFALSDLKFKDGKLLIWSFIFIFSLTSSFLAGHLQTFFYLIIISAIYFFAKLLQYNKKKNIVLLFTFCFLLFVLLTIVQWLPTLNFILGSARNVDQNWQKDGWFIPWQNLIQFIAPDFFGNPTTLNYWGVWNYAEFVGYVGIFPLLMAETAMFYRRDKKTLFFGLVLFVSLLFSLPTFFAKLPFILNVPFLSSSQPTRLLFLADLSLSALSALGLDFFIKLNNKKKIFTPLLSLFIIFGFLWAYVLFGNKYIIHITAENLLIAKRNLYFPTLMFLGVAVFILVLIFVKNKKISNAVVIILVILATVDLLRFSQKFNPFTDRSYLFPETGTTSYLQKQKGQFRIMTTDDRIIPPNFSIVYRLQTTDGYDPLYLLRYGELAAAIDRGKPDINPPFGFNRIVTIHNATSKFIDILGAKYVLSLTDVHSSKLKKVFEEGQTKVYENTKAFDRAFFVDNVKPVQGKNEAIKTMFDPNTNLKNTAIVENWNNTKTVFASGSVNIIEYKEESVAISTKNSKEGFLVLMDSFYPTWSAKICLYSGSDCKDAKIYLTDYNFRGIVVPTGEHKVFLNNNLL